MATVTRIAPVEAGDIGVVANLYAAAFDEPWAESSVRDLMAVQGAWGYLAYAGPAAVGFVLGRSILDEAEIISIGVLPDRRRGGVARALMAAGVERARQTATMLFLEVGADNPGALRLYAALGFKEVGQRRNYYRRADRSRVDARIMKLVLTEN